MGPTYKDPSFHNAGKAYVQLDVSRVPGCTISKRVVVREAIPDMDIKLGQEVQVKRVHVGQTLLQRLLIIFLGIDTERGALRGSIPGIKSLFEPLADETVIPLLSLRLAVEAPARRALFDEVLVVCDDGGNLAF